MRRIRKIQKFLVKRHRFRCRKRLERNAAIIKPFVIQVILKNNIKVIHIKMEILRRWICRWINCKRECFKLFEDLGVYLNLMNKEIIVKKILKKYEGKKKPMFNYMGEKIASNPKKKKKIKLNITEEKIMEISHKIYENLKEQNKYTQIIKKRNSEKKYTVYRMGTFLPKKELYLTELYNAYFADYTEYKRKEAEEEEANRPKPKPPSQPPSRRTSQISSGSRKSRISVLRRKSRISTASERNSIITPDAIPETIKEEEEEETVHETSNK